MLELKNISLRFENVILDDINLSLEKGSVIGIVGVSGGGKSSLLKIVCGLLDATSGSVSWCGQRVKGPSEKLVPGHAEIQLVNQDFALDLYHSVEENIIQKMLYLPADVQKQFCNELLELVELVPLRSRKAISLSGGEQQRLTIARALASEPEVLLLDEPFSHLDAHLKEKLGVYLSHLAKTRDLLCILVSHEGQDIMEWCQRVCFIHNGKVIREDSPQAFYYQPSSYYEARFFGEINSIEIDGREKLFRPNAYRIVENNGILLTITEARFAGPFYRNYTATEKGEELVLYSKKKLPYVFQIEIEAYEED